MAATITKEQHEMIAALKRTIKGLNQKLLFADSKAEKEQIEDDIHYMMKIEYKYYTEICEDITEQELMTYLQENFAETKGF